MESILKQSPFYLENDQIKWVKNQLEDLSLEQKIGQLFFLNTHSGFKKDLKELLQFQPGGIFCGTGIFLKKGRQKQTQFIQENSQIPAFIAADLELGGINAAWNATVFHTQMGVGATNNSDYAYKMGLIIGREGKAMGFNMTYSPVVDINYNWRNPLTNVRAFGDRPELVQKMSVAYMNGVHDGGITATAKHFPGDGMDERNQHFVTTHNSLEFEEWDNTYGNVYRELIQNDIRTIMCGHIDLLSWYKRMDPEFPMDKVKPASLSHELVENLLREHLKFNGLILSDASGMTGFTSHGNRDEIVPKVIANGLDMILFAHPIKKDFERMKNGYDTGIISKERLDLALTRILGLKAKMNLPEKKKKGTLYPKKGELKIIKSKEHLQWTEDCSYASITLVKDKQNLLPINPSTHPRLALIRIGDLGFLTRKFKKYLASAGFKVKEFTKRPKISKENFDIIIYLITIPGFYNKTNLWIDWKKIGMRWYAEEIPTLAISLGSPYHLADIPRIKTYINAYAPFPKVQKAAVDIITGKKEFNPDTKSPVNAFCGLFDAE